MENTMKSVQSEVSSLKTSKESSKRELDKYKQYYLEELRNMNLYELNRWVKENVTEDAIS